MSPSLRYLLIFIWKINVFNPSFNELVWRTELHLHYVLDTEIVQEIFSHVRQTSVTLHIHDDVIKWKHFPRNWPFVREIHRSLVNFPHKGQWRGALMFTLIYAWINDWVNNREAGDLRRQHGHYDVIVMTTDILTAADLAAHFGRSIRRIK